jgi:hypothetical protein
LLTGVLACGAVSLPSPVWAGNPERIAQLNKKAMASYDSLEFAAAKRVLEECVAFLTKAGMQQSIQAARTFINLGMVLVQMKDNAHGEQWFRKALAINPNAKLDPALATPDIQTVWDQAQGMKAATPPPPVAQVEPPQPVQVPVTPPTPPPEPTPPPPVTQPVDVTPKPPQPNTGLEYSADELLNPVKKVVLRHTPYEEIAGNQKFSLYFTPVPVAPGAAVARATLYYRTAGQDKYTEVPMAPSRKQAGDWTGQIPAEATTGRALQYYMEAFDNLNRSCGYFGSADNPTIIKISASRSLAAVPPAEDVEDPLLYVKREDERRRLSLLRDHVYIDVGVGTGYAAISSGATTEVAWFYDRTMDQFEQARANNGGLVWAGVGVRAELGVYLYRGLTLGVSGRFEAFLNHNADSNDNSATPCNDSHNNPSPCFATTSKGQFGYMVLGKLRYQFRQGQVFRPYVHLDVGGGEWRGALNIDGSRPTSNGMIDPSSPYQPTDLCSAEYNGKTDTSRAPAGCSSIGGNIGYNHRPMDQTGAPTNLNRVCPANGPCIDAVMMDKVMVGGGFGFYAGGRHAGLSLDFDIITALGGQFGVIIDTFIGPQFIF